MRLALGVSMAAGLLCLEGCANRSAPRNGATAAPVAQTQPIAQTQPVAQTQPAPDTLEGRLLASAKQAIVALRDAEATWAIDELLKRDPANAEALRLKQQLEEYRDPVRLAKLADGGNAGAMLRLGACYSTGLGVKADPAQAAQWYRKAAEKGSAEGTFRLGMCYYEGRGITRNLAEAVLHFQKAADAGNTWAMLYLGRVYMLGVAVDRDRSTGLRWMRNAAESGLVPAQLDLATCYERGIGIDADPAAAAVWRRKVEDSLVKNAEQLPDSPFALRELINFYMGQNQRDKAINAMAEATDRSGSLEMHMSLIRVLLSAGKFDEVERRGTALLQQHPDNSELLASMGFSKASRGQSAAGLELINQALKTDPHSKQALFYRSVLKRRDGDVQGSLADLEAACEAGKTDADLWMMLAQVYQKSGKIVDAVREYERVLQLNPAHREARSSLLGIHWGRGEWDAMATLLDQVMADADQGRNPLWLWWRARELQGRGDTAKALQYAQQAVQAAPRELNYTLTLLELLWGAPGGPEKIVQLTEPLVAGTGNPPPAIRAIRGAALAKLKQTDAARKEFQAAFDAVDAARDDEMADRMGRSAVAAIGADAAIEMLTAREAPRWMLPLARAHMAKRDWKAADKVITTLRSEYLSQLGEAQRSEAVATSAMIYDYESKSDPQMLEKAVKAYRRALELTDQLKTPSPMAKLSMLNNLAYLLATNSVSPDPQEALTYSTQACEILREAGMTQGSVLDTHGWVLVLNGRTDDGIEMLKKAAADPDARPVAEYHLAEAYLRKSQPADALEHFRRAEAKATEQQRTSPGSLEPQLLERIQAGLKRAAGLSGSSTRPTTRPATRPAD